MKIKWIVATVNSKRDINGNCYWAAFYTNTLTGKSVWFAANCQSNAESVGLALAGEWAGVYTTTSELSIRDWKCKFQNLPYLNDCDTKEAAKTINAALKKV